jgi:hypothetical protein
MVGHFPRNMYMGAYMIVTNVAQHESISIINLTYDWKVFCPYPLMKDLGMTI